MNVTIFTDIFRLWYFLQLDIFRKKLVIILKLRKAKNARLAARVFLRFSHVSQHPACLDYNIQTRETIWYFL